MSARLPVRWCAVLLVAAVAVLSPAIAQSPLAKPAAHAPATLRVGLWTLWHDKEVTVSPTPEGGAAMRTCDNCAAAPIPYPTQIRAVGVRLALAGNRQAASVRLTGPVTLAAHGESLTLRNPVRIAARYGELVLAVTLPV